MGIALVAGGCMNESVVTLELTPSQTAIMAPIINAARRRNVLLVATAAPDGPEKGWRFEAVLIVPSKASKLLKAILAAAEPTTKENV
jgi:hypothetical protein